MMAGNRMLDNGAELGFMSGSRGFYAAVACRTLSQYPGFASTDDASHTKRDSTKISHQDIHTMVIVFNL
jgi:hypothetical protein